MHPQEGLLNAHLAFSLWDGMPAKSMRAPEPCSYCWAPVAPATACLSAGSPWGWRLYCTWPSSDAGPSLNFPEHCKCLPRPWPKLPGALARLSWPGNHSRPAWSGRPHTGRCPHWLLPVCCSLSGPLVWTGSGTTGSWAQTWPPSLWTWQT